MSTIIEHPLVTEKAMDEMDFDNKLQFITHIDADKPEISKEVEERYDVTVVNINTQITPDAEKKATITLSDEDDATDVASSIGVFQDGTTHSGTTTRPWWPDVPRAITPLQGRTVVQEIRRYRHHHRRGRRHRTRPRPECATRRCGVRRW